MEKEQIKHIDTFLQGGYALILVYVALLSNIVVCIYDADLQHVTDSGKVMNILKAAAYVPEWLGNLCYYGSMLLFNIALYQGLRQKTTLIIWLKANVGLSGVILFFALIVSAIDEESDAAVLLALIAFVLLIAYIIVQIRLSRLMMTRFEGDITDVGKWMLISVIANVVLNMLAMLFLENAITVTIILEVIYFYIFYEYCSQLYCFLK